MFKLYCRTTQSNILEMIKSEDREMKIDPDLEVALPSIEEIASKFLKGLGNLKGSLIFMRLFSESLQSTFG